jgi:hypothetical protein
MSRISIDLSAGERTALNELSQIDLRSPENEMRWFLKVGLELRSLAARDWRGQLDQRQNKEVDFCQLYLRDFAHGTDGHNAKIIIAKLAQLLDEYQALIRSESIPNK